MKFYDKDDMSLPKGSFTVLCGCGMMIYSFHNIMIKPDPNNATSYFTKAWSPAESYDKHHKDKNVVEQAGFTKLKNGKYVR